MNTKAVYIILATVITFTVVLIVVVNSYFSNQISEVLNQPKTYILSEEIIEILKATHLDNLGGLKSELAEATADEIYFKQKRDLSTSFKKNLLEYYLQIFVSESQQINYLINNLSFGEDIRGLETASEKYFHSPLEKLTLSKKVVLIGIQQNPTELDINKNRRDRDGNILWKMRAKHILERMLNNRYITESVYNQSIKEIEDM